jgi:DNA-binding beta-propeller fold protein YncE
MKRMTQLWGVFVIYVMISPYIYAGQTGYLGYYSFVEVWESDRIFKVPESVCYDPKAKLLYVSNINGRPAERNGKGFISKLSPDGRVLKLKWATGLNAPKGMAVFKDRLYVSDIDQLVCIELTSGRILRKFPVEGAQFLNDVAVDERGYVYVSDSSGRNSTIYRLKDGKMEIWLKGRDIRSPNGLFYRDGLLYIGNSGDGKIKAADVKTKKVKAVADVGSGIDGLILDKDGFFIVSDWRGRTSLITKDGTPVVLMDTTDKKINSADLGYIPERRLVLIPTFFDDRVLAYRLSLR